MIITGKKVYLRRQGFTLVEILVALGILSLVIGIGGISYRDYSNRQQVTSATREIRSALRLAQTRALSGEKPAGCVGSLMSYSFRTDKQDPVRVQVVPTPTPTSTPPPPGEGLYGEYFEETNLTDLAGGFTRIDPTVNFNWGSSSVSHNGAGVGSEYSVRWTGYIMAPVSGTYTFYVRSDDGNRLWINNVQITNDWSSHAARDASGTTTLVAGVKTPVRLEFFNSGGSGSSVRLDWQGPGIPTRSVVAQQYLYLPDNVSLPTDPPPVVNGLTGSYYNNSDFTSLVGTRVDPRINFGWDDGSPMSGVGSNSFSVRWQGSIMVPVAGNYRFYTLSDDGVRLYINNILRINNWTVHGPTEDPSAPISLAANTLIPIQLDYYENTQGATIRLYYENTSIGIAKQIIPQNVLYVSGYTLPTPTPTPSPTPTAAPTPGPQTYIVEAVCSGVETPIVVQTLNIPASVNLSGFETITFKSVDGGTNIPTGQNQTITVQSPVNNYSELVIVESSGDVQ